MNQATKDGLRWTLVPIGYLLVCLAVGAVSAWILHGGTVDLSKDAESAAFYLPPVFFAFVAGALMGKDFPVKFLIGVVFIPLGLFAAFISGVTVACGTYRACL